MLFNSYQFLFFFLPACLVLYFGAARVSGYTGAKLVIVTSSLLFYSWWEWRNLPVLLLSLGSNYLACVHIRKLSPNGKPSRAAQFLVIAGIIGNLALLGYFKYTLFAVGILNALAGTHWTLSHIVLPLGISFFTFQKIALLMDASAGRVQHLDLLDFSVFVTFFPQLLSGPIVHHHEMMAQFSQPETFKLRLSNVSVGITLFAFGLFKKVVLADNLAPAVPSAFLDAANGAGVSVIDAWGATLSYTLQLYFDFSGYCDMALGLGRIFGIRLPVNFNSPLKARSMIDFWQRWHVTLGRFLTAYVYNPLILRLSRAARNDDQSTGPVSAFARMWHFGLFVAYPTMVTMLLCGFWHGAGFQFIAFGIIHGVYLTLNNASRLLAPGWSKAVRRGGGAAVLASGLTFFFVVLSLAMFRASDFNSGLTLMGAMLGMGGIGQIAYFKDPATVARIFLGLGVVWILPNSLQIMKAHLDSPDRPTKMYRAVEDIGPLFAWRDSVFWALCVASLFTMAIYGMGRPSEFLYFNF